MSPQTAYNTTLDNAVAGMIADLGPRDIVTRNNKTEAVPFGRGLVRDTNDDEAKLPDSGSITGWFGISVRDLTVPTVGETPTGYAIKSAMAVMWQGRAWVETEENVLVTDTPYVRYDGKSQVQTLTFDADLITANDVDMDIDGVAITTVPFNASHDQTMTDLAAEIQASNSVLTATTPGAGSRVITITAATHESNVAITSIAVTSGASQATGTAAETVAAVSDDEIGKFRTDADSSTAVDVSGFMKFDKTSTDRIARVQMLGN